MRAWLSLVLAWQALPACGQTIRAVPAIAPSATAAPLAGQTLSGASLAPQLSPSLSLPAPALGLSPSSILSQAPKPALSEPARQAPAAAAQAAPGAAPIAGVQGRAPGAAARTKAEPEELGDSLWKALESLPSAAGQLAFAREKGVRVEVVSFEGGKAEGLDPDNLAQFEPEKGVLRLNRDMIRPDMAALRGMGATEAQVSELMGLALAPVLAHELRHARLRSEFGADFPGLKEEEILTHADQARAFDEALRQRPELARLDTFILRHQREIWSKWKEGFGPLARFVLRKYESAPSLDGDSLARNAEQARAQREKILAMGAQAPASWLPRIEAAIRLWEDPAAVKRLVDFMQARINEEASRGAEAQGRGSALSSSSRPGGRGLAIAERAGRSAALSQLEGLAKGSRAAAAAPAAEAFGATAAGLSADASLSAANASKRTRPGKRVKLARTDARDIGPFETEERAEVREKLAEDRARLAELDEAGEADKHERKKLLKRLEEREERLKQLEKEAEKKSLDPLAEDRAKLDELQQMLYAQKDKAVLIVLQGMDTSGKDGTIRHVFTAMTPQGIKVVSFKKPTEEEARHDYLWRIRNALPEKGYVGVFNRSHYEDILVPSVYKTLPAEQVEARFDEINAFEKELADHGVTIVKFFLHISKAEQKNRLLKRLDDPDKRWKFSPDDLKSRERWDDFQGAYEKILERTSTPWARWHIIPADKKWYRDYLVGRILRQTMEKMGLSFPKPAEGLDKVVIPD